jgi:hypothetical protein
LPHELPRVRPVASDHISVAIDRAEEVKGTVTASCKTEQPDAAGRGASLLGSRSL